MILILICTAALAAALAFGIISSERRKGKYLRKGTAESGILSMLLPSVLGIGICCLCLIGGTYAWFAASITTPTQTIQGAGYDISVEISSGSESITPDSDGSYTLSPQTEGNGYTVTLKAAGTASTGYCKIFIGNEDADPLYTVQINQNDSLSFTLYPSAENVRYSFAAVWGTYSGMSEIEDGHILGEPSESTLEELAEEIETEPDENGTEADETGTEPDETETEPNKTGTELDETGTEPDETGAEPDETNDSNESTQSSGEIPDSSGEMPATGEPAAEETTVTEPQSETGEQAADMA